MTPSEQKKYGTGYKEGPKVMAIGVTICLTTLAAWGVASIPVPVPVIWGLTIGIALFGLGASMRLFPDDPKDDA